jgi:hypothetical protein
MTPKPKRAALYVRVSTPNRATKNPKVFEQDPSVQELPLRQLAEQRGWSVTKIYSDRMSGPGWVTVPRKWCGQGGLQGTQRFASMAMPERGGVL